MKLTTRQAAGQWYAAWEYPSGLWITASTAYRTEDEAKAFLDGWYTEKVRHQLRVFEDQLRVNRAARDRLRLEQL